MDHFNLNQLLQHWIFRSMVSFYSGRILWNQSKKKIVCETDVGDDAESELEQGFCLFDHHHCRSRKNFMQKLIYIHIFACPLALTALTIYTWRTLDTDVGAPYYGRFCAGIRFDIASSKFNTNISNAESRTSRPDYSNEYISTYLLLAGRQVHSIAMTPRPNWR